MSLDDLAFRCHGAVTKVYQSQHIGRSDQMLIINAGY